MSKGSDRMKLTVYSPKGDEAELMVDFDWWYDGGVMYHADGSGTPPDGGTEITGYGMANGGKVPDWVTDEMVQEALDDADFSFTELD
jgi:hypothetical protein